MQKIRKQLTLVSTLAAALAVAPAFAQDATTAQQQDAQRATTPTQAPATAPVQAPADKPQQPNSWSALDADGNGSLNVKEAASMDSLAKVFAKADADSNGELTRDEYKAWLDARAKKMPAH